MQTAEKICLSYGAMAMVVFCFILTHANVAKWSSPLEGLADLNRQKRRFTPQRLLLVLVFRSHCQAETLLKRLQMLMPTIPVPQHRDDHDACRTVARATAHSVVESPCHKKVPWPSPTNANNAKLRQTASFGIFNSARFELDDARHLFSVKSKAK